MKNTTSITIYHTTDDGATWERRVYAGCMWDLDAARAIAKTGEKDADALYISIPWAAAESLVLTLGVDLVVQGAGPYVDDGDIPAWLRTMRADYNVHTITTCAEKRHSTNRRLWHWEVGGR